eukprot:UN26643
MNSLIAEVRKLLMKNSNAKRAMEMKKYMRDQFEYFGIQSKERRDLCKKGVENWKLKYKNSTTYLQKDLHYLIEQCFKAPERELHYFGIEFVEKELLTRLKKQKEKGQKKEDSDIDWEKVLLKTVNFLLLNKAWWDTVDLISTHYVGEICKVYPEFIKQVLVGWSTHENVWHRRVT